MFHIALYQPEIPPNTGNIIRLCANTGCYLHLIKPLGFTLDEKQVRRAGLDYQALTLVTEYNNWDDFLEKSVDKKIYAFSTKGKYYYTDAQFNTSDILLFGPETRGLPKSILANLPPQQVLRLPMQDHSRSLNLSNTVAIAVYEAWRQHAFINGQ